MLLYHGTPMNFDIPSLEKCKPHRDFGRGFYLAQNYFDALPMSIKNSYYGVVQTYELEDIGDLNVLVLDGYSDEWLSFVVRSRLGAVSDYDIVIGNMAAGGANLKAKFSKFRANNVAADEVAAIMINELTRTALGVQYAFLTPVALSKLRLINTEIIEREDAI